MLIGKALRPRWPSSRRPRRPPRASYKRADRRGDTKAGPARLRLLLRLVPEPATDGLWAHWNHKHLDHWDAAVRAKYPPFVHDPEKRDVGASFFPALGAYSSVDDAVITAHFEQLRKAKVGVAVVSWYPPGKRDANGPEVDGLIGRLLDAALGRGLALCLHLEPWEGRTAAQLKDVAFAVRTYGAHEAYYKIDGKCVFFAYDSYQLAADLPRRRPRRTTALPHRAGAGSEARRRLRRRPGRLRRGLRLFWRYWLHPGLDAAELVAAARDPGGLFVRASRRATTTCAWPWNGANCGAAAGAYDRSWTAPRASGAARRRWLQARGHADRTRGGGVHAGPAGRHYRTWPPVAGFPDEDGGLGKAFGGATSRVGKEKARVAIVAASYRL